MGLLLPQYTSFGNSEENKKKTTFTYKIYKIFDAFYFFGDLLLSPKGRVEVKVVPVSLAGTQYLVTLLRSQVYQSQISYF